MLRQYVTNRLNLVGLGQSRCYRQPLRPKGRTLSGFGTIFQTGHSCADASEMDGGSTPSRTGGNGQDGPGDEPVVQKCVQF